MVNRVNVGEGSRANRQLARCVSLRAVLTDGARSV